MVLLHGKRSPRTDHEHPKHMRQFFTTHSHSWRDVGLARQLSRRAVKRARIQSLVLLPVLVGVLVVYGYRDRLFGPEYDDAVRIVTFLALISLGWQFARDIGRALGPTLFRRMDPGTAGHGRVPAAARDDARRGAIALRDRRARPADARARRRVHRRRASASRRSRRSATCSPAWCCSARGRSASASG